MIAFVLDADAAATAKAEGARVRSEFASDAVAAATEAPYGSASFKSVNAIKLKALNVLLDDGHIVFYLDCDVVVLRDFVSHFFTLPPRDVYLQSDEVHFGSASRYCTGVMFLRPTPASKALVHDAQTQLQALRCKVGDVDAHCTDQEAINEAIKHAVDSTHAAEGIRLRVDALAPADYPNGAHYFGEPIDKNDPYFVDARARASCSTPPMLVHNNWLNGRRNKVTRLQLHNLWFVSR